MDFLGMDGYAAFVWPSYGLMALVLMGLWITSLRRLHRLRLEKARLDARRGQE